MGTILAIKNADFSANRIEQVPILIDPILQVKNFNMSGSQQTASTYVQQGRMWYPLNISAGKTYRFILQVTGTTQRSGTYDVCCVRMVNSSTLRTGEDAIPTTSTRDLPAGQSLDNYTIDSTVTAESNHTYIYVLLCWNVLTPDVTPTLNLSIYEVEQQ